MSSDIHAGPLPQADADSEHHPGPLRQATRMEQAADWWQTLRQRRAERRAEREAAHEDHQAGPLAQHEGPTEAPVRSERYKKSWREKRWERRRRRRFFEEILGWILVPLILLAGYWAVKAGLNALGTNFTALIQGIKTALSAAGRG